MNAPQPITPLPSPVIYQERLDASVMAGNLTDNVEALILLATGSDRSICLSGAILADLLRPIGEQLLQLQRLLERGLLEGTLEVRR